jgi:hypothetical protein
MIKPKSYHLSNAIIYFQIIGVYVPKMIPTTKIWGSGIDIIALVCYNIYAHGVRMGGRGTGKLPPKRLNFPPPPKQLETPLFDYFLTFSLLMVIQYFF